MLGRLRKAKRSAAEIEESYPTVPRRSSSSLVRDALIVMLDPERGRTGTFDDLVVAGAVLVELAREGRLAVAGAGRQVRVTVRDATPVGDEDLDEALLSVRSGILGNKVSRLIHLLPPGTTEVLGRLVEDGLVVEETRSRLGMFTVHRHYPAPAAGRDELVGSLRRVLLGEAVPDERTALLATILAAGLSLRALVPAGRIDDASRRSEELLERLGDAERTLVTALAEAVTRAHRAQ